MRASQLPTAVSRLAAARSSRPTMAARGGYGEGGPRRGRAGEGRVTMSAPAPLVLERYRLQRRLGTGAFGTVWLAHDERLDREVAVKVLAPERVLGGRFEREARAAARLSHPGIVTLYEAAVDDDGAYLVSELVRGTTFEQLLAAGRLSDRDIVMIGIALCDALAHAHAHGVVHRDVKPSNVLVPEHPVTSAQVAKLTDFGVARVVGGDTLTQTGDVIGTLAYMAPEQAEGLEATESADLYSVALVLYEALTGVNPVAAAASARRARRLGAYLPPLRRQRRELPRELGQAIDLALRPRPRERGRIEELARALGSVVDRLDDRPGVVTGAFTSAPDELAAAEQSVPSRVWRRSPRSLDPAPAAVELPEAIERGPAGGDPSHRGWPERAIAAAAAAGIAAWLSAHPLASLPLAPAACALLAGGAVLLRPRLGWLALSLLAVTVAVLQHDPGTALVLLIAAAVPALLLPGRSGLWPVPAAAVALGLVGLAGAWPALAARGGSTWRRAGLAATGWLWLALAGPLAGRTFYLPHLPGTASASGFAGSASQAVTGLLLALIGSGVLAGALVWAAAAAVLPLLVRGRSPAGDLVRSAAWAAGLLVATGLALASGGAGVAPSAVAGAFGGMAVAAGPALLRHYGRRPRSARPSRRLS